MTFVITLTSILLSTNKLVSNLIAQGASILMNNTAKFAITTTIETELSDFHAVLITE